MLSLYRKTAVFCIVIASIATLLYSMEPITFSNGKWEANMVFFVTIDSVNKKPSLLLMNENGEYWAPVPLKKDQKIKVAKDARNKIIKKKISDGPLKNVIVYLVPIQDGIFPKLGKQVEETIKRAAKKQGKEVNIEFTLVPLDEFLTSAKPLSKPYYPKGLAEKPKYAPLLPGLQQVGKQFADQMKEVAVNPLTNADLEIKEGEEEIIKTMKKGDKKKKPNQEEQKIAQKNLILFTTLKPKVQEISVLLISKDEYPWAVSPLERQDEISFVRIIKKIRESKAPRGSLKDFVLYIVPIDYKLKSLVEGKYAQKGFNSVWVPLGTFGLEQTGKYSVNGLTVDAKSHELIRHFTGQFHKANHNPIVEDEALLILKLWKLDQESNK